MKFALAISLAIMLLVDGLAQTTTVQGKVVEATTGSPIPFANVVFVGTTVGATTDFDGRYNITISSFSDSIQASYIGYVSKAKAIITGQSQTIDFQLEEDLVNLDEVVVMSGENPAFAIMRGAIANKKLNDKRSLDAFEYESYTKIEIDVDNISEKFQQTKLMKRISNVLDSIQVISGEDGRPLLPMFISEALSKYYFKSDPFTRHEEILKTKVSGVGITDGTTSSQVIGATFQEYNFYRDWMTIVEKEFVSPLARGWKSFYEYDLVDSLMVGEDFCYRLDVFPKRKHDLAFSGTIWITKNELALRQIDVTVEGAANLNFVKKIKIQQELEATIAGPWLPSKTRIVIDIVDLTKETLSMLAKFYVSNKNFEINIEHPDDFYRQPVEVNQMVRINDREFWAENRHDPLTETEVNVFEMIDSLKAIPFIRVSTALGKFAGTGYLKTGNIGLGPYPIFYANNNIEGNRVGMGFKTNLNFSGKWEARVALGYGFKDQDWKHYVRLRYIPKKDPWTEFKFISRKEVDPIFLLNTSRGVEGVFYTFTRFGNLANPFVHDLNEVSLKRQFTRGLTLKTFARHQSFLPLFDLNYYKTNGDLESGFSQKFQTSEVGIEARFAFDERFLIDDNKRFSLGINRWPAITATYTHGIDNLLESDFGYNRLDVRVEQKQRVGPLGTARIKLTGGYVWGSLPYPLLKSHIGNESPVYAPFAYNLMDYFEFTSDRYAAFNYRHHFEGQILNRLPLVKYLKLRLVGTANILFGELSQRNRDISPQYVLVANEQVQQYNVLENGPYIELGYGIENIFKFFRVDAFHRLTYLDEPDVRKFGIKFSAQFIL